MALSPMEPPAHTSPTLRSVVDPVASRKTTSAAVGSPKAEGRWTFWNVVYPLLAALVLAGGAWARFRLPQWPIIDNDFSGYLTPALDQLSGGVFAHCGRDTLYPAFAWLILRLFGDFRALVVVQHLLGLATGGLMLFAWEQASHLLGWRGGRRPRWIPFPGLVPAAVFLTAPSALEFEMTIRPEAIFPLFVLLSIVLNLAFIRRRWLLPQPGAIWFGAVQLIVSVIAWKLKPSYSMAVLLTNLPLALALVTNRRALKEDAAAISGALGFCALFLIFPETLLKRQLPSAALFLPDTLLTIHANLIREQIARDLAAHRASPFPASTVQALLSRLDALLPLSRLEENHPYRTLGFNPDFLLYTDCVYHGVTPLTIAGFQTRAAMGMYYYQRTFLHHPAWMLKKIGRQLALFYHFRSARECRLFGKKFLPKESNPYTFDRPYAQSLPLIEEALPPRGRVSYPPAVAYRAALQSLTQRQFSTRQPTLLLFAENLLEMAYWPVLLATLLLGTCCLLKGGLRHPAAWPFAIASLLYSYNFGNTLTVAVVHSLDISRYVWTQLSFTMFSSAFGLLFVGATCARAAESVLVDRGDSAPEPWPGDGVLTPVLPAPSLCVLIPCYNEATCIAGVVAEFRVEFPHARILVVDNASSDGTAAVAAAAGADVLSEPAKGKARAVLTALSHIDSEVVLMVDGDGSYPAAGGRRLLESYRAQPADLITGIRNPDESMAGSFRPYHQGGTHLFGRLIGTVFGRLPADLFSGLRLFSRRYYENVPILSRGFELELELTIQAIDKGFSMREVPVPFGLRAEGTKSKLRTVHDGVRILRLLFVLFRDYRPLLCFSIIAGLLALLGLLAGFAPIRDYLTIRYVTHVPLAILAASLMVLSCLALQTGLVLESGLRHLREMTQLRIRRGVRQHRSSATPH